MYELWFSFPSEEDKAAFLNLVREDGYANAESIKPPATLDDLPLFRPLGRVFSEGAMARILAAVQLMTGESSAFSLATGRPFGKVQ